ncbi:MAG: hypothetical protein ACRD13_06780 [Terriglobales bacterium]
MFAVAGLALSWALASPGGAKLQPRASARSIIPGRSVGPVRLGERLTDLRRLLQAQFPRSRAQWTLRGASTGLLRLRECGEEVDKVGWGPPRGRGLAPVTAYLSGGRVFLISSGAELYHTAEGLKPGNSPDQVEHLWPNLRAYSDAETSMALYNRPVIYWVSQAKGIAFAFASNGPGMGWTRSLYSIEVFRPSWKFQPHGCAWPGEWSPLPSGTIHLRHPEPKTRIALGISGRGQRAERGFARR